MTKSNADYIEVERRCLVETDNAMHVWAAYSFARAAGDPIPDWVMRYFDMVARGLFALAVEAKAEGGKDMGPKIARAMGLASKGRGAPLVEYHNRWMTFGMNVRHRMQQGDKEVFAIESVAKSGGVSISTVERAYKRYAALFPGEAIFPNEAVSPRT